MRATHLLMRAVALASAAALVTVACGGGSSSTQQPTTAAPNTTPGAGGGQQAVTVIARNFVFSPDKITATPGQTLTVLFDNSGPSTHTFTVYSDANYTTKVSGADSGHVSAGGSATVTVPVSMSGGTLYFRCEFHPTQMRGVISVGSSSGSPSPASGSASPASGRTPSGGNGGGY